ncbi:MAG: DNA polymerase III subunit epsilon [Pseudomonadota bacterium]
MRQVVLDTETTGLEPHLDHRIIEIGCIEMVDRRPTGRVFHRYLNPEREIDAGAIEVHGITNEFLADKPRFADIVDELMDFIRGAQLIIHNAPFDVAFLNAELARLGGRSLIADQCAVLDTLALARSCHPGQRNSLDALCKRYMVDNSQRTLHGALLDAEILADVYLAMTGGQTALLLGSGAGGGQGEEGVRAASAIRRLPAGRAALSVVLASSDELERHRRRLAALEKSSQGSCLWLGQEIANSASNPG